VSLADSFDAVGVEDWLRLLPATCLRQYVSSPAILRVISRQPNGVAVSDLSAEVDRYPEIRRAVSQLKRALRSRDILEIRPVRNNWIVPDSLGFSIEGKGRTMARRSEHICQVLEDLAADQDQLVNHRRALRRLAELIGSSRGHPSWLYWYSPQTIALARNTNHQTLFEINQLATTTLKALGLDVTIASWEEAVGVVIRRLPLSLLLDHQPTRRSAGLIRKLEQCGVTTLGGLTVLSTDSLDALRVTRIGTLEACALALRDCYLPQTT
jgi:hypothetical protein